ncbi:hypothetical protein K2X33_07575 [bacterium]|nr:hypothetical protein [bacterium]
MKTKFSLLGLLILSNLALAGQPHCPANSSYHETNTGFRNIGGGLSCTKFSGGCVNTFECPQYAAPFCANGKAVTIVTQYKPIGKGLACPQYETACVEPFECRQNAPLMCAKGTAVYITTGFTKLRDDLSCPVMEAACVDASKCPTP